jgi:hypothetical protein
MAAGEGEGPGKHLPAGRCFERPTQPPSPVIVTRNRKGCGMEFWLVVGLIIGVVLAWAAISDRRDRRYHRLRSHSEMADDHREHLRDVRAADMGSHLNPDTSWMHRPGSSQRPRGRRDEEDRR